MSRSTGGATPSVMSATSAGAQPTNSAAIWADAAAGSVKSMPPAPLRRTLQGHMGVQDASGLAMRQAALARYHCEHAAAAHRRRARRVADVRVGQPGLDEEDAGVGGLRLRDERAHP